VIITQKSNKALSLIKITTVIGHGQWLPGSL